MNTTAGTFSLETGLPEPWFPGSAWTAEACARELAFARWCKRRHHLCMGTVDLIWYLNNYRKGFPKLNKRANREVWIYKIRKPTQVLKSGVWQTTSRGEGRLMGAELRNWVRFWHPHPGRWDLYLSRQKRDYIKNRASFRSARHFWDNCPLAARRAFFRYFHQNDHGPTTFPDCFVVFRGRFHAFVEVKGFRESVRPSQREAFPMLVKKLSLSVLLVRIEPAGRHLRWFRVDPSGIHRVSGPEVLPNSSGSEKPTEKRLSQPMRIPA
jgi:hypothetical protein